MKCVVSMNLVSTRARILNILHARLRLECILIGHLLEKGRNFNNYKFYAFRGETFKKFHLKVFISPSLSFYSFISKKSIQ